MKRFIHIIRIVLLFTLTGSYLYAQQNCPSVTGPTPQNCWQMNIVPGSGDRNQGPPLRNQDCCGAKPLCDPVNIINNGVLNQNPGFNSEGCIPDELPSASCLASNERGTTWWTFRIRPLPGGPTAPGSPAGVLRFKIIPNDVPNPPINDPGNQGIGATDYDFALFNVTNFPNPNDACAAIKATGNVGAANSIQVSCNYSGTSGPTGLFEPGTVSNNGAGGPRYNIPIPVTVGQVFILAIDNFSTQIQGFIVDFRGIEAPAGSAPSAQVTPGPIDTIRILSVTPPECADTTVVITFTNPIRCDSVRPDKFTITGPNGPYELLSTTPIGSCDVDGQNTKFRFTFTPALPDTGYMIKITQIITDICGNQVIRDSIKFDIKTQTLHLDSILSPPECLNNFFTIKFDRPVRCDSVKARNFTLVGEDGFVYTIQSMLPFEGCNPDGQDSIFIVTYTPFRPDPLVKLIHSGKVRDKCNFLVAADTLSFSLPPPDTLTMDSLISTPTCTNLRLTIKFSAPILCDSISKPGKLAIINGLGDTVFASNVRTRQGFPCAPGVQDSIFIVEFNRATPDTSYRVKVQGLITDRCGKPVRFDSLNFVIPRFLEIEADKEAYCSKDLVNLTLNLDSAFRSIFVYETLDRIWKVGQEVSADSIFISNTYPGRDFGNPLTDSAFIFRNGQAATFKPVVSSPRFYIYRFVATKRDNGCRDSSTVRVSVGPTPKAITERNAYGVCYGETLGIEPTYDVDVSSLEFTWFDGADTTRIFGNAPTLSLPHTGDDLANYFGNNINMKLAYKFPDSLGGCKGDTLTFRIKVATKIIPDFNIDEPYPDSRLAPYDVAFVNNATITPEKSVLFRWLTEATMQEIRTRDKQTRLEHTYFNAGTYSPKLTINDTLLLADGNTKGCVYEQSKEIEVEELSKIPNLLTLNEDGKNDLFEIKGLPKGFRLTVLNRWGKEIYRSDDNYRNDFNPKDFAVGIYYYLLEDTRRNKKYNGWIQFSK